VEKFFKPCVDAIIERFQRLLSSQTYDLLILTGGFGASPYLKYALEMRLTPQICLVLANWSGSEAVAIGGLIHLVQPPCKVTDHHTVRPWISTKLRTWRNFEKIPSNISVGGYLQNFPCALWPLRKNPQPVASRKFYADSPPSVMRHIFACLRESSDYAARLGLGHQAQGSLADHGTLVGSHPLHSHPMAHGAPNFLDKASAEEGPKQCIPCLKHTQTDPCHPLLVDGTRNITYENNLNCDVCDIWHVGNVSGPEASSEPHIDVPEPPSRLDTTGAADTPDEFAIH